MPAPLTRRTLLTGLGAATLVAGCSKPPPKTGASVDQVTMLTNNGSNGRDGYPWVTQAMGWFSAENLHVTVQPGYPATTSKALDAGRAQFGSIDFVNLSIQRGTTLAGGPPGADLRAVAAIHQRTLACVVALAGSGIQRPADLMGRTIAVPTGSVLGGPQLAGRRSLFDAYARLAGFDATKVRWAPMDSTLLTPTLAAGHVDGVVQYLVGAPTVESVARRPTVVLAFADYITDLFGGVLVTPQRLIDTRPDMVRRFTRALMRGLSYSVTDPAQAGRLLHGAVPATAAEPATAELRLMAPYVTPTDGVAGEMSEVRVMRAIAALVADGLVPPSLTPADLVASALTPRPV